MQNQASLHGNLATNQHRRRESVPFGGGFNRPGASEGRSRRLPFLADAISFEDFPDRQEQDADIQPQGAVVHVPDVQVKLLFPADGVAAVDLGPAGDARADFVPAALVVVVEGEILHQ